MMHLWSHPISDAQLVDLRLQAREEARRKRALRVRKIDSDDILLEPAHPAAEAD